MPVAASFLGGELNVDILDDFLKLTIFLSSFLAVSLASQSNSSFP
jgi:hypothetical protein